MNRRSLMTIRYHRRSRRLSKGGIKPTSAAAWFALLVAAVMVAAMNYGNSLAYLLAFILAGMIVASAVFGYRNLEGLTLESLDVEPVFAGQPVPVTAVLTCSGRGRRWDVVASGEASTRRASGESASFVVEPGETTDFAFLLPPRRRGRGRLTTLTLRSRYPLGLFTIRRRLAVDVDFVIYPRPRGGLPWPAPLDGGDESFNSLQYRAGGDDFSGLRPYRAGEPQQHVDWKSHARGRPLSVKEFSSGGGREVVFRWDQLAGRDVEARLSQLTLWVVEADASRVAYGLDLPGEQFTPSWGPLHRRSCLLALALYGES